MRVRAVLDRRIAARELHDLKTEPVVHDCGPSRDAARRAALADAMRRAALLGGAAHASPRFVVAVRACDQSYGVCLRPGRSCAAVRALGRRVLSTAPLAAPARPASFTSSAELTVAAAVAPVPFGRPAKDAGLRLASIPKGPRYRSRARPQAGDVAGSGTGWRRGQGPIDGAAIAFSMGSDNAHGFRPIGVAQLDRFVRALAISAQLRSRATYDRRTTSPVVVTPRSTRAFALRSRPGRVRALARPRRANRRLLVRHGLVRLHAPRLLVAGEGSRRGRALRRDRERRRSGASAAPSAHRDRRD